MDLSKNLVLKENYTFLVADEGGAIDGGEHGLYDRDTRFLSRYAWRFGDGFQTLLAHTERPDRYAAHHALIEGPSQAVGITRRLELEPERLMDALELENTSETARRLTLRLDVAGDFVDMFEARGWMQLERPPVQARVDGTVLTLRYCAQDDREFHTRVRFHGLQPALDENGASFELELEPGERVSLRVEVTLGTPFAEAAVLPPYEAWRESFDVRAESEAHDRALRQAVDDLRALLLASEHGTLPAAGIPWYVAAFGRDALLTAFMMLPWGRSVAEGTLRYLAAHQGREHDEYRAEQPGKIMHELRYGELTRLGRSPHSPYYGTIDATALFVMLLHEHHRCTSDDALVRELQPAWEAALDWMVNHGDLDGDGFLEFVGAEFGKGLVVQSWKDSHDSLSHEDGSLAEGAIAVSEVQGYAYAAYVAGAEFYALLGDARAAAGWRERAASLRKAFHESFWLEDLGTYAMALDGRKRPLRVQNSDAGQLLWTGIVPEEVAPRLVRTLFSEELWSGWGVRTLGTNARRYNPVSYHNGSVWPHDTALIAGGLARYGFRAEAHRIRDALFDLAAGQADARLPELIAGYERHAGPPVPYPVACRPQAWDAAALLYLLRIARPDVAPAARPGERVASDITAS